jgi:asparagine synthase (glutamine-hydrolysing)
MCGICGWVDLEGRAETPVVEAMAEALEHRGPDGRGIWRDPSGTAVLGHRRLAVLDTSSAGAQPMVDRLTGAVLVFNGEVYNFAELRTVLADEGRCPFASSGDTEVVLALLAEGGAGAIDTLEGMFALALWQPQTRSLLLVRDRLGLKPLFWTPTDRGLAFASELPALLRHPEVRRDLDAQAVERWLMLGYGVGEDTLIRGVRRLPPGHVLEFSEASGVAVRRWFDLLRAVEAPPSRLSPEAAAEALEPIVRRAVRQRLVADVPLGCFLSGGVDSAVVAAAARAEGHALDTLTIRMEDGIDEGPDAVRQARILDLEHRVAACAVPDLETFLDSWEQVSGDPLADPSLLPTWMVSREARRRWTVALSGDGGDELLSGYPRLRAMPRLEPVLAAPRRLRTLPAGLLPARRWAAKLGAGLGSRDRWWCYQALQGVWPAAEVARLIGRPVDGCPWPEAIVRRLEDVSPWVRWRALDLMTFLPERMLAKVDRASMAHGLEVRVPLVDHRLTTWGLGLPPDRARDKGLLRAVLRRMGGADPPARKRGFEIPLGAWLRGRLRSRMESELSNPVLDALGFDRAVVAETWQQHLQGREDNAERLLALVVLGRWVRRFT